MDLIAELLNIVIVSRTLHLKVIVVFDQRLDLLLKRFLVHSS